MSHLATGQAAAPIAAEQAKRVARAGDDDSRALVAALPDTAPELLYYLSTDRAAAVRAAVATNFATPVQADRRLADDADPRVRALLGRKLAPLVATLHAQQADRLGRIAWETLASLAADTAIMVRAVIADELKALPDAPREMILALARDAAMEVAEPIIRCSPLLTDADLLALVQSPPVTETVTAVARRPDLGAAIGDAIVGANHETALLALLDNPSAMLRESTVDLLIAQAAGRDAVQTRLVRRPVLSPRAAYALTAAVADHLLTVLTERRDLGADVTAELRRRVAARLAAAADPLAAPLPARFAAAARGGDRATMRTILANAAGVSPGVVDEAVRLRSGKALTALCRQAGFPPELAMLAQAGLAGLGPAEVLPLGTGGECTLTAEETSWQLKMLAGLVAEADATPAPSAALAAFAAAQAALGNGEGAPPGAGPQAVWGSSPPGRR